MEVGNPYRYDVTILGGGPGGYTAALEATKRGYKVAMVEKDRVGGTCLNRGCIPTQCLLHDAIGFSAFLASEYIDKDPRSLKVDIEKMMERKDRVVDLLVTGTEKSLLSQGVEIFHGEGSFVDPRTIAIRGSEKLIKSDFIIIATGGLSRTEPQFEVDHRRIWDTTDAVRMESVPETIAILGGGHWAMTFSDIFHFLGSKVSIISQQDRILPDQDREVSSRYTKVLKEKKIGIFKNSTVVSVERDQRRDCVGLTVKSKKGVRSLTVDKVLAIGDLEANVQGLNLDKVGLSLRHGFVPVDRNLASSVSGVCAIGDAIGGRQTGHKAIAEGTGVVRHLAGETANLNPELIPLCLYTKPEIASIGLTQQEAEKTRDDVELGYFPFAAGARPVILDEGEGIIKVVVGRKYGEILGVHIIGPRATELISLASMAMKNELSVNEIKEVICAHPSFAENFLGAINDVISIMERR